LTALDDASREVAAAVETFMELLLGQIRVAMRY
jgi:hypothetical protein